MFVFASKVCLKLVSNVSLQRISSLSFMSVGLNEHDNFRSARLLAFCILKLCLDLEIEMKCLLSDFQVTINFNTLLMHYISYQGNGTTLTSKLQT